MDDRREARGHAPARLREEADHLLAETRQEQDPAIRRKMHERAELLERTAEMLDMAETER
jgi:hypothetical protein